VAKRVKRNPNQLPLICEECGGGPIDVAQHGDRVVILCESCGMTSIALMLEPLQPVDNLALREIEIELLGRVSEIAGNAYKYIRQYQVDNGFSPTFREIQEAMGWASVTNVRHHLGQLAAVGLIEREYATSRSIRLPHAA
jgi:hypothetical protein